jgi:hypothetical protein
MTWKLIADTREVLAGEGRVVRDAFAAAVIDILIRREDVTPEAVVDALDKAIEEA